MKVSLPLYLQSPQVSFLESLICLYFGYYYCQIYFKALCIRTERAAAFIFMVDGLQCILLCGYTIHDLTSLLLVGWMIYIPAVTDTVILNSLIHRLFQMSNEVELLKSQVHFIFWSLLPNCLQRGCSSSLPLAVNEGAGSPTAFQLTALSNILS